MILNKNFINYKVLDPVKLYNFDINFVFLRFILKRYEFICVVAIFKGGYRLWKSIFRYGCLKRTASENHSFSETVDISNRPWK
jgi:hypothetical protein